MHTSASDSKVMKQKLRRRPLLRSLGKMWTVTFPTELKNLRRSASLLFGGIPRMNSRWHCFCCDDDFLASLISASAPIPQKQAGIPPMILQVPFRIAASAEYGFLKMTYTKPLGLSVYWSLGIMTLSTSPNSESAS